MPFPLYYCPPGIDRPAHIATPAPFDCLPTWGPADCDPSEKGGRIYGDAWDPASAPFWKKSRAGWWLCMAGRLPRDLLRLEIIEGALVPGTDDSHQWIVPSLLRLPTHAADAAAGLISAIPREFRDYRWQEPERFAALQRRLRDCMTSAALFTDEQVGELAIEVLRVNYHVTMHEMTLGDGKCWFDHDFALRILALASGVVVPGDG